MKKSGLAWKPNPTICVTKKCTIYVGDGFHPVPKISFCCSPDFFRKILYKIMSTKTTGCEKSQPVEKLS